MKYRLRVDSVKMMRLLLVNGLANGSRANRITGVESVTGITWMALGRQFP